MKKLATFLGTMILTVGISTSGVWADGYEFSQNIYKMGTRHQDVSIIQQVLEKEGSYTYGKITTYFGSITQKAVKSFQKKHGLKADGIVGKATISKMKDLGLTGETTSTTANTISRGSVKRKVGQYLDWWSEVSGHIINRQDVLLIEDYETGKTFRVKVTVGTNHADVEPVSKEDTAIMKAIWGGFSWERRSVLVYKDDVVIAASMTNMPHAGVDSKEGGITVSGRSGGYGRGYNFDFVKGNGVDGHVDLHFKNSLRHKDDKQDPQHQNAIKKAAGLK